MISNQQEEQLTGSGECFLHYHPDDRVPTHDTLNRLQNLASIVTKSAAYTLTYNDDWVLVSATSTMTLPMPKGEKEFEIVCVGAATTVTIAAPTGSTINGASSVNFNTQWTGKRVKAINSTAYVAI